MGKVHCGQGRGVGGNHQIFAESALHPEAGYAKSGILIGEGEVADIERRLRNAPRHTAFLAIFNLALYHQAASLVEQAVTAGKRH